MTPEKALATYYTGQYMVAAQARMLFDIEVGKGCDGSILPNPVALEPDFRPITSPRDIMAIKDRPAWVFETPPKRQELIRYRVWLSSDQPFDWDCLELFVKQLSLVSNRVGLEITGNQEKIDITLLCHRSDIPLVTTAFLSKLKFCKLSVVTEDLVFNIEPELWKDISFYDYFPSSPYSHLLTQPRELHTTPYEALITAIANIPPPAVGIYQVLFQPVSAANNWHYNVETLTDLEYKIKLVRSTGPSQHYEQQVPSGAIQQMAGEVDTKAHNDKPFYSAAFRIAVVGAGDNGQDYLKSLRVFSSLFQHGGRPLKFITQDQYNSVLSPEQIRQMFMLGLTYRTGFLVNSAELTGLVHFPAANIVEQIETDVDKVETLMVIADSKLSEGTPIGTTSVAGQRRTICIPDWLRLCNIHIIGKPRKGKSRLLELMIMDDIKKGHGVVVIEPHHDLVARLLSLMPEDAIDRVIYFNPADPDWVPLWNPLHKIPGQDIGRITDDLIGVLRSFVTGWGDRMENILRHSIFGLLHLPGSSLRDVYDILCKTDKSKKIRDRILETVQDDIARQFWIHDFEKYKPDELGPPKNKLSKLLLSNTTTSLMLSQPESRFNFRRIIDDGMVFLADLSSDIGTQTKEVLGGFLVAIIYITALSRKDIPLEKRKPSHIYLDEGYHFITDTLEEILAETPKFGVGLTIAHQYRGQFDTKKADALGTVGTTIVFNVDSKDAERLSKNFKGKAKVSDFIELKKREAIVRCDTEIVKIRTLDQLEVSENNFKDRIIAESRRKYCMPAHQVRKIIEQRSKRANKPHEPLAPAIETHKKTYLSQGFSYGGH
jgi:hypothetical protein